MTSLPRLPEPHCTAGSAIPTAAGPRYDKVRDPLTGKLVEDKPANRPYLKHQAWKAARAAAAAAANEGAAASSSAGKKPSSEPSSGWSAADVVKTLVWLLMLGCVLGKFVTDSPVWGYEPELRRAFRDYVVRVRPSRGRFSHAGRKG